MDGIVLTLKSLEAHLDMGVGPTSDDKLEIRPCPTSLVRVVQGHQQCFLATFLAFIQSVKNADNLSGTEASRCIKEEIPEIMERCQYCFSVFFISLECFFGHKFWILAIYLTQDAPQGAMDVFLIIEVVLEEEICGDSGVCR